MIQTLPPDLHPETGLAAQDPAGVLNAVRAPVSGAEGLHPGAPAGGSWWSKTWATACAPEVTQAGLQTQDQTGPPGWAW